MGIRETFGRAERSRFVNDLPDGGGVAIPRPAPIIPVPSAELKREIVFEARELVSFERVASELSFISPEEAQVLWSRTRALGETQRIDDLAISLGLLTAEQVKEVVAAQGFNVSVNAPHGGSPAFLTWVGELVRQGVIPTVKRVSAQDLAKLKERREVTEENPEEIDLDTLNKAKTLFMDCAAVGASDLHVLIRANHTELQVRVKSELKTCAGISLHDDQGERLVRAMCMGLATVKPTTFNPLDFQDAQISGDKLPFSDIANIRIIRGPSWPVEAGGGFLVARIQYNGIRRHVDPKRAEVARRRLDLCTPTRPEGEFRLKSMGFTLKQVGLIERLMLRPTGVVFVSGPTGSGKTTTAFEVLLELGRRFPGERIVTIENPPEYPLEPGVQLEADSEEFPTILRMTLRMDPDTIAPSEIRGKEEAVAAIQAAMTGHRVWTSVHVNDAFETFSRLEMLEPELLPGALIYNHRLISGLIAQRRVPLLCPDCARSFDEIKDEVPPYMMDALRSWGDLSAVKVRGIKPICETCHGDRTIKEQAIAEVVVTDEELMDDCRRVGPIKAAKLYRARPDADNTMMEHAMELVLTGKLDPFDAMKIDEIPMKKAEQ